MRCMNRWVNAPRAKRPVAPPLPVDGSIEGHVGHEPLVHPEPPPPVDRLRRHLLFERVSAPLAGRPRGNRCRSIPHMSVGIIAVSDPGSHRQAGSGRHIAERLMRSFAGRSRWRRPGACVEGRAGHSFAAQRGSAGNRGLRVFRPRRARGRFRRGSARGAVSDDLAPKWDGREVDLHFVHLPEAGDPVSGSWAEVVRESQEVVKLALKGLLRAVGIEPPRIQAVSDVLMAEKNRLDVAIQRDLNTLAAGSRRDPPAWRDHPR